MADAECIIGSFTIRAMSETAKAVPAETEEALSSLDIQAILKILPHRYPFLLIDRVMEITRTKRIVAIKNVTVNEPFFVGHFPAGPIMPGVLIVEAMAQAGGVLLLTEVPDREDKLLVFTGIERARFRRPVTPGDQLRIEVDVLVLRGNAGRLQGKAYVDGKLACEAVVTCRLLIGGPEAAAAQRIRNREPEQPNLSMSIHPTAIVDPSAKIPASCSVGPYCVIHAGVELGENCELQSHVVVGGPTRFGATTRSIPSPCWAWIRRTSPITASPRGWKSATETSSANTSPSRAGR